MAWNNPNATSGAFDTAAKQGFRSIGGAGAVDGSVANSRFSLTANTLTEAHFRNLLQNRLRRWRKIWFPQIVCRTNSDEQAH